jgi:hypothetical protein
VHLSRSSTCAARPPRPSQLPFVRQRHDVGDDSAFDEAAPRRAVGAGADRHTVVRLRGLDVENDDFRFATQAERMSGAPPPPLPDPKSAVAGFGLRCASRKHPTCDGERRGEGLGGFRDGIIAALRRWASPHCATCPGPSPSLRSTSPRQRGEVCAAPSPSPLTASPRPSATSHRRRFRA